jgi:V/A-type H+-transporting ATPase subunit I
VSIVSLVKITAYGHVEDKEQVLADLQDIGCLHLIPLTPAEEGLRHEDISLRARNALVFLADCAQRRHQVLDPEGFDAEELEERVLSLKETIGALEDEQDLLRDRIKNLRPFGYFDFPDLDEIGCNKFWFYVIPRREMQSLSAMDYVWQEVNRDNRFSYVVVVSPTEPVDMPIERLHTGGRSLEVLERRLEVVQLELEDLQSERSSLTRWIELFAQSINRLDDRAARNEAASHTYDDSPVFAIQAWALARELNHLRNYATKHGMVLSVVEPSPDEEPPTLLENKPTLAGGQDLVSFYTTPNYWLWDPSSIVFFSFTVFFAMIISDAAYGGLMALILAFFWKRLGKSDTGKRLRRLGVSLVSATIIYGIMVGSYFGISPPEDSLINRLNVIDLNNFGMMMKISIFIGVAHLIVANVADAWRARASLYAFVPLGWICMFIGAVLIWLGISVTPSRPAVETLGTVCIGLGIVAVLLFSRTYGPIWKRVIFGLQGLTRLSGAFGDALSYLRLFALGLASASLAATFNELSRQVGGAIPGIGFLFSLLIIILGHGMNMLLAIASGVIHGLRLNFIEFFNWSMPLEGHPFKVFARKEKLSWTT